MAQFDIVKLNKSYGAVKILTDIDLVVEAGEFLVLVGPSGSGKSTLLRIIAGLEEASSGIIAHDGVVKTNLPPQELNLAMVFQDYALYPHMTVRENMSFGLRIRGEAKVEIDRRVTESARMLGLSNHLDRRPAALSGGQRQRVAMGRAIVRDPVAYLFDEPLSNLDAKLRVEMRAEIVALQKRVGATTIYVTHDQVEAMTMGDRIVILRDGRIEQIGKPMDLYLRPNNLFVARFIGTPPMNILDTDRLPGVTGELAELIARSGARHLGVRPEHLALDPVSPFGFLATDIQYQNIGATTQMMANVDGTRVEVSLRGIQSPPSGPVKLFIEPSSVYLFDSNETRIDFA